MLLISGNKEYKIEKFFCDKKIKGRNHVLINSISLHNPISIVIKKKIQYNSIVLLIPNSDRFSTIF